MLHAEKGDIEIDHQSVSEGTKWSDKKNWLSAGFYILQKRVRKGSKSTSRSHYYIDGRLDELDPYLRPLGERPRTSVAAAATIDVKAFRSAHLGGSDIGGNSGHSHAHDGGKGEDSKGRDGKLHGGDIPCFGSVS